MTTFETGKTYETRSICDYNCIFRITVIKRTAKMMTFLYMGKESTVKIHNREGVEFVYPFGKHSMAACISAK